MNLSEKLRRFLPAEEKPKQKAARRIVDLDPYLQGAEIETPSGTCYIVEKRTPLTAWQGKVTLSQVLQQDYRGLDHLEPSFGQNFQLENALFLDTETTGLAGGTGTYAFLIGLGYFTAEEFVSKQLLMRDYNEEQAVLHLLAAELAQKTTLVSFNGKSFDIPLLQTRFALSRLPFAGFYHEHLDLLHMSRRLWRSKLASCSLNSLEENILGINRIDDLPGFLIPQRYFDFLTSGDGELLQDIVRHNLIDILSMPVLLYRLLATSQLEPEECDCPWEGEALARLAQGRNDEDLALAYLQAARGLCQEAEQHVRILKAQATIYKRRRDYKRASKLWFEVLNTFKGDLFSLEELAKYYEHHARDLDAAHDISSRGLTIALQTKSTSVPAWRHRLARIEGKAKRALAGN